MNFYNDHEPYVVVPKVAAEFIRSVMDIVL